MSRKRKPLPPRHKRLTRQGRLQAAKAWLRSYPGISGETFYGFAFIAGYTAGGLPYGITIEEAKSLDNGDLSYFDATPSTWDDDIPF